MSMAPQESDLKAQVERLRAYCKELLSEIERLKAELTKWRGY